jgi:hypothetical protein
VLVPRNGDNLAVGIHRDMLRLTLVVTIA